MIKKFWTITQKEEIEKYCSEYGIPQDIIAEIFRIIHILDENYGVDRALELSLIHISEPTRPY